MTEASSVTKQIWRKPKSFTTFGIPSHALEEAVSDIRSPVPPTTLEEWGQHVEQPVDVALRKLPVSANLPRPLPKQYRGRCQDKQILVTALVPRGRHGDFEPAQEVHNIRTASMITQATQTTPITAAQA